MLKLVMLTVITLSHTPAFAGFIDNLDFSKKPFLVKNVARDERDFSQCLTDVCGSASTFQNYQDVIKKNAATAATQNSFNPLENFVEGYFLKGLVYEREDMLKVQRNLNQGQIAIAPELLAAHKLHELINAYSDISFDDIVDDQDSVGVSLVIKINRPKLKKELTKIYGSKKAERIEAPFVELMENEAMQNVFFGSSYGWAVSMEQLFPNKTLKEIVAYQTKEYENFMDDLNKKSPRLAQIFSTSNVLDKDLLERVANASQPSETLLNNFFPSIFITRLFRDYLFEGKPEFNKFSPQTIYDLYPKDVITKKLNKRINELKSLSKRSPEVQQNVQHCRTIYQDAQAGLPTKKERIAIFDTIREYKDEFKQKIAQKIFPEMAEALGAGIDRINFDVPSSSEDYAELMEQSLKTSSASDDREHLLFQSEDPDLSLYDVHELMGGENKKEDEITNDCDDYELGSLEDYSLQLGSGKVKVSWLTLKDPAIGKGIIAHELGHALSSLIRSNKMSIDTAQTFVQARQCVNQGSPNLNSKTEAVPLPIGHIKYEANMFLEENWADIISGKFLDTNEKNFACYLVSKNEQGQYDSNKFLPEDDKDTHSPELYRILKVERTKNAHIPASCTSLLRAEELQNLDRNCI